MDFLCGVFASGWGLGGGMRVNNAYCGHIILTIHIHYMAKMWEGHGPITGFRWYIQTL